MDETVSNGLRKVVQKDVVILTLDRPEVRNALNWELTNQLQTELDSFIRDDGLRVAIITGSDPGFCSGVDLKEFSAANSPRTKIGAMLRGLPNLGKVVIAAVNGSARAGGLELALGCDFIISSEVATFGDTHVTIGALAGSGMTSRLPFAVGARWAKQMVLTCQPIDAWTAQRIGLVNEVVPHPQLLPRALQLARSIASHHPDLITIARNVIDRGVATTLEVALKIEAHALAEFNVKE